MDIQDIATPEYVTVEADERLGKVRSVFERQQPGGIVVTEDGAYSGIITARRLLQSHVEDDAKARVMVHSAPKVARHDDVRDVARMLIEGNTKVAPVFENGELWGIVTTDAILEAVLENLGVLTVEDVYTADVITLEEDDHVGKAINHLREHGVSRLPIVSETDSLSGMVTVHDITDVAVRSMSKTTTGDRAGDSDRVLDLPVTDVMNTPVATVTTETTVDAAVRRMFDTEYAGLVVTPPGDETVVEGILTKTDVLRALTYTAEDRMDVQITNVELLDTLSREDVRRKVTQVSDKYRDMQVQHAHVRLTEHKEKLRGTPLIQCQIRLRTNHGQVAGSGEGYGAESAFHVALETLERNVIELKGIRADEEYEGQLLRKLGEL